MSALRHPEETPAPARRERAVAAAAARRANVLGVMYNRHCLEVLGSRASR